MALLELFLLQYGEYQALKIVSPRVMEGSRGEGENGKPT